MFKDLLVHLDGSNDDRLRLAHTEILAASSPGARVTGIYTNQLPEYTHMLGSPTNPNPSAPIMHLDDELRREADNAIAQLKDRWQLQKGLLSDIRRIDDTPHALIVKCVQEARWADLFIACAPTGFLSWKKVVEAVLFDGGHGVYLVPRGCTAPRPIRRVLIAWSDTREAARAVAEATPLLGAGTQVRIVMVEEPRRKPHAERASDLAAHLARCGATVEILSIRSEGPAAATLLDQSKRFSADLVIMGGYGHSRFSEWLLGGTTLDMMEQSEVPLLLAH